VVRIRRSHRRGPGSIPGVGKSPFLLSFSVSLITKIQGFLSHVVKYILSLRNVCIFTFATFFLHF